MQGCHRLFSATALNNVLFLEVCSLSQSRIKDPLSDTKACRCYLKKLVVINELDALLK